MSRQNNIRWTRSDYSKLSHMVRKVNKKVFEQQVKRPDIADFQPEMLNYQEIKKSIKTRHDLKMVMNKYNRYLKEGAEEVIKTDAGGVLTKWQRKEIQIFDRTENAKRTRKAKKLGEREVTVGGKGTGQTRSQMGNIKENDIKKRKHDINKMNQDDINAIFRLMDKKMRSSYEEERKKLMIENYVKGLISEGYSDELIKLLNKIDVDVFLEIIDTDELATFDFIYDPLELKAKETKLIELWKEHLNNSIDNKINYSSIRQDILNEYAMGERIKGQGRIKRRKR